MKWKKHGVVWCPDGEQPWALTHATCPTPIRLRDGTLRVFVQCRDERNVGRIGYVDLDSSDPPRVLRYSTNPVLEIGAPGSFDDNGVFPTSAVEAPDGSLYLYYVGFELCQRIRYRLLTGLAISVDGGVTFRRVGGVPILERSAEEPHFRCGTWVRFDSGFFRMWYVAGSSWDMLDGKMVPIYDIRYAESPDGIRWPDHGRVVLALNSAIEHGFGRPYVLRDVSGAYRMHYSIRRREPAQYRMGFARSEDGLNWHRDDAAAGIEVSSSPWETDSVEFGAEVSAGGKTWLLYNGNDFGRDGFCIAERLFD